MAVLLDTHVWAWWSLGDERLKTRERDALDRLAGRRELRLCAISLWEAQMAAARGRLRLLDPFEVWLRAAAAPEVIEIVPIDIRVALALNALPASLPKDPADRLIVAAARAHALPLATRDGAIRRSRATRLWKA
ncbi:MAG: type II toxin-antitoxin system VapC family toxin [Burkholderiales bacterium]